MMPLRGATVCCLTILRPPQHLLSIFQTEPTRGLFFVTWESWLGKRDVCTNAHSTTLV